MDPVTAHHLAGDDRRSGIGIAQDYHAVYRRDQPQIAPLSDQGIAIGTRAGKFFPCSRQGCIRDLSLLAFGGNNVFARGTYGEQFLLASCLGLGIGLPRGRFA